MSFAVATGLGPFPIEMLRRDQAWPMTELDSNLLNKLEKAQPISVCLMNGTGDGHLPNGPLLDGFCNPSDHGRMQ